MLNKEFLLKHKKDITITMLEILITLMHLRLNETGFAMIWMLIIVLDFKQLSKEIKHQMHS